VSILDSARATFATVLADELVEAVTIKRAAVVASAVGGNTHDWTAPVTITTTTGPSQPATAQLLEQEGLQSLEDAVVWYLADVALTPETHRLYTSTTGYEVKRVTRWQNAFTRAITVVIADEEESSG
jgi:hypothetical protein